MLRAWAQLLRLPNVFTAPADVVAGAVLALGAWPDSHLPPALLQLCLASVALYLAGMVLNDVFDVNEDRVERPHRPVASGKIHRTTAGVVGAVLLFLGIGLGVTSRSFNMIDPKWYLPVGLATLIAVYDAGGKRTILGPWLMGACRGLNVSLGGMLVAAWQLPTLWAALTVTLYITGVTYFARSEARVSERRLLLLGTILMCVALVSLVAMVLWLRTIADPRFFFGVVLALIWGFLISRFLLAAYETPSPQQVQAAIKACIFGLVGLEAIHVSLVVGLSGMALLLLLFPAVLLGRWVYST